MGGVAEGRRADWGGSGKEGGKDRGKRMGSEGWGGQGMKSSMHTTEVCCKSAPDHLS